MSLQITPERPDTSEARTLIGELDEYLTPLYPSESRHGFSVDKLIAEGVSFFVMRYNVEPAGCGALKLFPAENGLPAYGLAYAPSYAPSYAEVKRMYVRPQYRGKGFGKMMLDHLTMFARQQGVPLLRLETGIYQVEAIRLYERMGFVRIEPFGEYRPDPLSIFYEKCVE